MSNPLRVVTFNIRYGTADDGPDHWRHRKPRAIEAVRNLRPDILCMQEPLDFQLEEMRVALGGFEAIGVARDDGKREGEFSPILFDHARIEAAESGTFWYSETPEKPGSTSWGNKHPRICTWAHLHDLRTASEFYVYNTHLDRDSQHSREKSVDLLLTRISSTRRRPNATKPPNALITGDFNVDEDNAVIELIRNAGFQDSFRILHPHETNVGTLNDFQDQFLPEKIDYIFVSSGIEVLEAAIVRERIDGRWPSDHAPVTGTIGIAAHRTSFLNRSYDSFTEPSQ